MATSVETFSSYGDQYVIEKDPNAVLDYSFDWAPWLAKVSDQIDVVTWIVDSPLTVVSQNNSDTGAVAFISGGTLGKCHRVTCRIQTIGGRTDDRSIFLQMVER